MYQVIFVDVDGTKHAVALNDNAAANALLQTLRALGLNADKYLRTRH